MQTLMDRCCDRCTHSPASPCKDYVTCRKNGPVCHEDEHCRQLYRDFIEQIHLPADSDRRQILICAGTGCTSSGSRGLVQALENSLAENGLDGRVSVKITGCHGFCEQGPLMIVEPEKTFYTRVEAADAPEIVASHLVGGRVVERLLYIDPASGERARTYETVPFYARQKRLLLGNCGHINPENIAEYVVADGYLALSKVLFELTPEQVIEEVKTSGLRGRGGAGFPTGLKWSFVRQAEGDKKYAVCNADEGDPGAFMDRSVLEGDPHSVLEGIMIAGYAIGADEGYIYCRAEYPLAIKRLKIAIAQAEECGLLGKNILDSGFNFHIHIKAGAGAFVCGEETALLASIEGRRGMPRVRPPFPAQKGLWEKPTNINNVETYANVPLIIRRGGEWYASMGTEKSKGTKIFALTGKVNNTGLVEVPMGITVREIVFDIGGGIKDGKKYKAVQTGGPSGGCIPEDLLDLPVDYESLARVGAIMGSGGMVVMDEGTCMVDVARFFLSFTQSESCGKCTPCREGTTRMLEILERITQGAGVPEDLDTLEKLANVIKNTALCGLGQTCPNPVLSTLRYFRHEYEAHIKDKHCAASVCAALFLSPCQNTCPAGVDVPVYVDLIKNKRHKEAYEVIKKDNPFPLVCGRVCHHPCESRCRRAQIDEPMAIRALKRFAGDFVFAAEGAFPVFGPQAEKKEKVAIIGAGPAGLTAAFYLRLAGYRVTVYEAAPVAGGMMMLGIPRYRLPREPLLGEIEAIEKMGVEIKYDTRLGRDISVEALFEDGFKAVFLAVGGHKEQMPDIPGTDLAGVVSGISFLREVNLDRRPDLAGKTVGVIGGGNVAIDAARSALRLGAESVEIFYRRLRQDMPALEEEVEEAEKEGVKFRYLVAPSAVEGEKEVTGLVLERMTLGASDASGRRRPVPVPDSAFRVGLDMVILAVGQVTDVEGLPENIVHPRTRRLTVDQDTLATAREGVFAGGDCVTGPATVIQAIAAGKKAARSIDRHLGGTGNIVPPLSVPRQISGTIDEQKQTRREMRKLLPGEAIKGFAEVESGFSEEDAVAEASRCLRCDVIVE